MSVLIMVIIYNVFAGEDLTSIMSARSVGELIEADKKNYQSLELRDKCEFERQEALFPKYCFLELENEMETPQEMGRLKEKAEWLNKRCLQFAKKIRSIEAIESNLTNLKTSLDCKKALKQQILDLKYSKGLEVGTLFEEPRFK